MRLRHSLIPALVLTLAGPLTACGGKKAESKEGAAEGAKADGGKGEAGGAGEAGAGTDGGAEAGKGEAGEQADGGKGDGTASASAEGLPCKSTVKDASSEDMGAKTYEWDAEGRLTKQEYKLTNGNTIVSTYTYEGETSTVEDVETKGDEKVTRTRSMERHEVGYVVLETDDSRLGKIVHKWEFDASDRPTKSVFEVGSMAKEFACTYEYPENDVPPAIGLHYGQSKTICGNGASSNEYTYDDTGKLTKITMASGDVETFEYTCG